MNRFVFGLCLASLWAAPSAFAGPPGPPPMNPARVATPKEDGQKAKITGKIAVELLCVRATNTHGNVDPKLQGLLQHLRILKYKGFDLVDEHTADVAAGQDAAFEIEGGRRVKIDLLDVDAVQARIRVRMFSGKAASPTLDTTIAVHRNRAFIVAGPKMAGDDVLILPLRVKY
jgi:hypothetical protein